MHALACQEFYKLFEYRIMPNKKYRFQIVIDFSQHFDEAQRPTLIQSLVGVNVQRHSGCLRN
jgi:hypothetical protein